MYSNRKLSNTDMMRRVVGQRLVLSQERCLVVAIKVLLRAVAVVFWRLLVKCSKINVDKISDLMNKVQISTTTVYILLGVLLTSIIITEANEIV